MNSSDHKRILDFYEKSYEVFGNDPHSVHWADENSQIKRFELLSEVADLNNKKVLDVGCGLGDLYKFFIKEKINVDYTGIDVVPAFIDRARERFLNASFLLMNAEEITEDYDYILASGAFTFAVENAKAYYFEMIKNLFNHAKEGFAFNMLNIKYYEPDETYITYDPGEVVAFCKTLTPNVKIVTDDAISWDFTIYMYKEN